MKTHFTIVSILVFVFILTVTGKLSAEIPGKPTNDSTKAKIDTTKKVTPSVKFERYKIEKIIGMGSKFTDDASLKFEIEDYVKVYLNKNIDSLITLNQKDSIVLWLKGIAFPNVKAWRFNTEEKFILFKLERDFSPKSSWNIFYNYSYRGLCACTQTAEVAIGTRSTPITKKSDTPIELVLSVPAMVIIGVILILLVTVLLVLAIKRSNLVKANLKFASTFEVVESKDPTSTKIQVLESEIPYSLARLQLVWWTYIVIVGFIFIWMCTDELAFLPTSIALLIGITGGTSVVGKISEAVKESSSVKEITSIAEFEANFKTKNLLYDLVSDEKGLSIARIQFAFFSLLFGLYLVWQIIYQLQFPVFSDGILLLMGISSTTYAGVKFGEK